MEAKAGVRLPLLVGLGILPMAIYSRLRLMGFYAIGGPAALIERTNYSNTGSYVLAMAFNYTTEADVKVGIVTVATPITGPDTAAYRFVGQQDNNGAGFISFLNDRVRWVVNDLYAGAVATDYTMTITNAAGTWSGSLYFGYGTDDAVLTSLAATTYTAANDQGATSGYVGISASFYNTTGDITANPINVQWFYMRAYPPGGAMPTVSFGSIR